jgi:hypothetical protein
MLNKAGSLVKKSVITRVIPELSLPPPDEPPETAWIVAKRVSP